MSTSGIGSSPVDRRRAATAQGARYLIASAAALACDVAVYALLLRSGLAAAAAGTIGYGVGLLVHYSLSAAWVFPDRGGRRRTVPTFAKFAATGVLGLAMTTTIIAVLAGLCGAIAAKMMAVGVSYVAVFVLRRLYVFAPRQRAADPPRHDRADRPAAAMLPGIGAITALSSPDRAAAVGAGRTSRAIVY